MTSTNKVCTFPFRTLDVYPNNEASLCCPSWNNHPKLEGDTLFDKFYSPQAEMVRESIRDGSFKYCKDTCPFLSSYRRGEPNQAFTHETIDDVKITFLNLSEDRACNLACPSCRKDFIIDEEDYDIYSEVKKLSDTLVKIVTSGSGDPLYNKRSFNFLQSLNKKDYPYLEAVEIHTNAMLLNETTWDKLKHLAKDFSLELTISVDAATQETYENVRRGGSWLVLERNLNFLSKLSDTFHINLCYCVQQANYSEMIEFFDIMENRFLGHDVLYRFFILDQWYQDDVLYNKQRPSGKDYSEKVKQFITKLEPYIMNGKITHNLEP